MIQDMTPSYYMAWHKVDLKLLDLEPIELTAMELKAVVVLINSSKSVSSQRQIIVELMMSVTDNSLIKLFNSIDEKILDKIMIQC